MLTAAEFTRLLKVHGVPATWLQAKPPAQNTGVRVIFGTVGYTLQDETIANAYGADAHKIQVLASDLPEPPAKFDAFLVAGKRHVVDVAMPMVERGTGAVTYYICVCKGVS